jgi:hypothetical protein
MKLDGKMKKGRQFLGYWMWLETTKRLEDRVSVHGNVSPLDPATAEVIIIEEWCLLGCYAVWLL